MKKNIYYNILKIIVISETELILFFKNTFKKKIELNINQSIYKFKEDEILEIILDSNQFDINVKTEEDDFISTILFKENITIPEPVGFGQNSLVETMNGTKKINELSRGSKILNNKGYESEVLNVYIFKVHSSDSNFPILIKKSNCGINLPSIDLIISVKNILKIKKVTLKGRSLILNRKAVLYEFDEFIYYYSLQIENNNNYFVNGFLVSSV